MWVVDLILVLSPLRVVDAVNPLLSLDHHTPIPRHVCGARPVLLTLFDRNGAVEIITSINLQALLVGSDV